MVAVKQLYNRLSHHGQVVMDNFSFYECVSECECAHDCCIDNTSCFLPQVSFEEIVSLLGMYVSRLCMSSRFLVLGAELAYVHEMVVWLPCRRKAADESSGA